jgi:hypothetical protein
LLDTKNMVTPPTTMTLQQIIDDRISFLREQINLNNNKPEINSSTFQIQIDIIRAVDDYDIEKVESIIEQKKALLKNSKDVNETDRLFAELDGLEWLQRQIEDKKGEVAAYKSL